VGDWLMFPMRPVAQPRSVAFFPHSAADTAFDEAREPVSETRLRAAAPVDPDTVTVDELSASMADALADILRDEKSA
jgi:hypothetical protein